MSYLNIRPNVSTLAQKFDGTSVKKYSYSRENGFTKDQIKKMVEKLQDKLINDGKNGSLQLVVLDPIAKWLSGHWFKLNEPVYFAHVEDYDVSGFVDQPGNYIYDAFVVMYKPT